VLDGVGNPAVAALLLAKSAQAAERGIDLTVRKGSYLPPDSAPDAELVTIVGNLVDNAFDALSAMPAAGGARRVEVAGELLAAEGEAAAGDSITSENSVSRVQITVTDSGPGLTVQQAAAVFAPGWSTKKGRGPAGDRGLGLALVAQAVARCGGTVVAEPGRGARFVVRLPYRGTPRASEAAAGVAAAGARIASHPGLDTQATAGQGGR